MDMPILTTHANPYFNPVPIKKQPSIGSLCSLASTGTVIRKPPMRTDSPSPEPATSPVKTLVDQFQHDSSCSNSSPSAMTPPVFFPPPGSSGRKVASTYPPSIVPGKTRTLEIRTSLSRSLRESSENESFHSVNLSRANSSNSIRIVPSAGGRIQAPTTGITFMTLANLDRLDTSNARMGNAKTATTTTKNTRTNRPNNMATRRKAAPTAVKTSAALSMSIDSSIKRHNHPKPAKATRKATPPRLNLSFSKSPPRTTCRLGPRLVRPPIRTTATQGGILRSSCPSCRKLKSLLQTNPTPRHHSSSHSATLNVVVVGRGTAHRPSTITTPGGAAISLSAPPGKGSQKKGTTPSFAKPTANSRLVRVTSESCTPAEMAGLPCGDWDIPMSPTMTTFSSGGTTPRSSLGSSVIVGRRNYVRRSGSSHKSVTSAGCHNKKVKGKRSGSRGSTTSSKSAHSALSGTTHASNVTGTTRSSRTAVAGGSRHIRGHSSGDGKGGKRGAGLPSYMQGTRASNCKKREKMNRAVWGGARGMRVEDFEFVFV